jgi:hypothetical protein
MRLILAAIAVCLAMPAAAQQCAPRDYIAGFLLDNYGERVTATGLDINGTLMTMWANTATGTWTLTATNAQGVTCLLAEGQAYEAGDDPQGVDG